MITKTVEKHQPIVGMMSCVGIMRKEFPLDFGNYFWLSDGLRIINMWGENLTEAARVFNLDEIECTVFSDGKNSLGFVTDTRIPDEWKTRLCVTGCGWGTVELCKACLEFANVENDGNYCGCEKEDEAPHISQSWVIGKNKTNNCHKCGRKWE